MIWLRIQIDRINRFWRGATPFFPDDVTLQQDDYTFCTEQCSHLVNYIVSFTPLHYQFYPITQLVLPNYIISFRQTDGLFQGNGDSLCWKSLFNSSVCQRNSHNDIFMLVKQGYQCHCSCLLTMGMLRLYIGRVVSIYPMVPIYSVFCCLQPKS